MAENLHKPPFPTIAVPLSAQLITSTQEDEHSISITLLMIEEEAIEFLDALAMRKAFNAIENKQRG